MTNVIRDPQVIEALFAKLGRIVTGGEDLNDAMEECLGFLLKLKGLDAPYIGAILGSTSVENMRRLWEAMMSVYFTGEDAKVIASFSKRIDVANKKRNNFVHSRWAIDKSLTPPADIYSAVGSALRKSVDGGYTISTHSSRDFDDLIAEQGEIYGCLHLIRMVICRSDNPKLVSFFTWNGKRYIRGE